MWGAIERDISHCCSSSYPPSPKQCLEVLHTMARNLLKRFGTALASLLELYVLTSLGKRPLLMWRQHKSTITKHTYTQLMKLHVVSPPYASSPTFMRDVSLAFAVSIRAKIHRLGLARTSMFAYLPFVFRSWFAISVIACCNCSFYAPIYITLPIAFCWIGFGCLDYSMNRAKSLAVLVQNPHEQYTSTHDQLEKF